MPSPIAPISLPPALLKTELATMVLKPGASVVARVIEQQGGKGTINIAGWTLAAALPESVSAGDRLALRVSDQSGPEQVILRIVEQGQQAPQTPLAPVAVPLPDGRQALIQVDDDEQGRVAGDDEQRVALTYSSPQLGALGLRLGLEGDTVRATVSATPGEPLELARERAEELRGALTEALGRPAEVAVVQRRDPIDTYA